MAREPRSAPNLPGHEFVKHIGSGGFADVFLYREVDLGGRDVAVKVLDPKALPAGSSLDHFQVEANLMARVSQHPYIVQIFSVGRASDGRPYLAMEYYPNDNFERRARSSRMSVSESLAVGVRIASAVETAHTANIIHHDIKPANILTSEFGLPGLTDFGIAVVQEQAASSTGALSIPWSSPEALRDQPTGKRSDVYSIAASVYTMLAGRAPYEQPGGDNSRGALMRRGKAGKLPPTGRDDVPKSLELTLLRAMSTNPNDRQESAAEFGRDLQVIESELGFASTTLAQGGRVEQSDRPVRGDSDATEARPVTISPLAPSPAPKAAPAPRRVATTPSFESPQVDRDSRPRRPAPSPEPLGDTVHRSDEFFDDEELPRVEERKVSGALLSGAGVVLIAAIALFITLGGSTAEPPPDDTGGVDFTEINDGSADGPIQPRPAPLEDLVVVSEDGVNRFSWQPSPEAEQYNVIPDGGEPSRQEAVTYETNADCIEVQVIGASGDFSDRTRACA